MPSRPRRAWLERRDDARSDPILEIEQARRDAVVALAPDAEVADASMSSTEMRRRCSSRRTVPSSMYLTPSSDAICLVSEARLRYDSVEARAMTYIERLRESAEMISSVIPSPK